MGDWTREDKPTPQELAEPMTCPDCGGTGCCVTCEGEGVVESKSVEWGKPRGLDWE